MVGAGLQSLAIRDFRNIASADVDLGSALSVFEGDNGAGKTSILEAVYVLCRARSFHGVSLDRLIRQGATHFIVRGMVGGERVHRVGLQRGDGRTQARLDGSDVRSLSQLAALLPVQVLNTRSQEFLTAGPGARRAFLNWGVFHVEQGFRLLWQRYERALRQRNAALRQGSRPVAVSWVAELVERGIAIDGARRALLERLEPYWREELAAMDGGGGVTWRYRSGWTRGVPLADALGGSIDQELRLGYTLHGPHRADLRLQSDGVDAANYLSRGQQKRVVMALKIAMTRLLVAEGGVLPVLLIDDVAAELDRLHRASLMERALFTGAQVMATCVEREQFPSVHGPSAWFHVEQGTIREMI